MNLKTRFLVFDWGIQQIEAQTKNSRSSTRYILHHQILSYCAPND